LDRGTDVELATSLQSSLDLSLYESRAYLTLIRNGELSPGKLSQISGIPRPRAYDVLRTLVERGFASERPGRPVRFAPTDPSFAINTRLSALEEGMKSDLEDKREASKRVLSGLARIFDDFHRLAGGDQSVVVGSTTNAIWKQLEMLMRDTTKEYVAMTANTSIPPYGVFTANSAMLERGVKFRLIRPFPSSMRRRHAEWYSQLVEAGAELRMSDRVEFAFDVSDSRNAVIWLNETSARPPSEAVWLRHQPMATLLKRHFEEMWRKSNPVDMNRITSH
jgi:sugar-specific transcriptional regulator TrmB